MREARVAARLVLGRALGGKDIGPRGWLSFNTTDSMADAVVDCGFDLVASATNHAYDWGLYGAIEHSREMSCDFVRHDGEFPTDS